MTAQDRNFLRLCDLTQPKTFCPGCSKNVLANFAVRGYCRECAGRLGVRENEKAPGPAQLDLEL